MIKLLLVLIVMLIPLLVNEPHHDYTRKILYTDLKGTIKRQVDCLADNIYFEARGESKAGQKAVALVTINRTYSGLFPKTVCGVVRQTHQEVCQFSWWCNSETRAQAQRRKFAKQPYALAREIAMEVYFNYNMMNDVTKGALFYHAVYVPKSAIGVSGLRKTAKIGRHIFYKV
mgnify:FL=1